MKHLTLRMNCEGMTPAQIAEHLRKLADQIESGNAEKRAVLADDAGKAVAVVNRPAKAPSLLRAKPTTPAPAALKLSVSAVLHRAKALKDALANCNATGAAAILVSDLQEPANRIVERLTLLESVEAG